MFEQQIQAGMKLLTKEQLNRIDLDRLNMSSCWDCVLGQLYGEYTPGKAALGIGSHSTSVAHGFNVDTKSLDVFDMAVQLTEEWRVALIERRIENEITRFENEGGRYAQPKTVVE